MSAVDLRRWLGAVALERDVLRASGPEAIAFLQGQLSQEVTALPVGDSAWTLLLQPQGKVDAWLRITRTAADEVVLDVDAGHGAAVRARLERFKLRTKCEIEPLDWTCVAVRGPGAAALAETGAEVAAPVAWPGVEGVDLLGPGVTVPPEVPVVDQAGYEALRIEAGVPRMGAELGPDTIPAEAGPWLIEVSVDFTKGCFTGQELVARIDSRGGNVPRRLRGLVLDGDAVPPAGASVLDGDGQADKAVGVVTSAAASPGLGSPIALASLGRAVSPPARVTVAWDGARSAAEARELPLVR
jgi:folate-binding protein YgfZ